MERVLKKYQERLNDISRRNRAIRLSRIIKKKVFDLSELAKVNKEKPLELLKNVFFEGKQANLVNINVKNKDEEKILKEILYMKRDVEFILKEKGYYECFLGYPFIQGNFFEGSYFRAPLFLLPIKIETNRSTKKIVIKPLIDSTIQVNKTFFMAFNKYNKNYKNIDLEELKQIEDLKPNELLNWANNLFKELNLETNFEDFEKDKIKQLTALRKDEHPKDLIGKIEFLPLTILGQFNQLNSAINNDYDELIKNGNLSESSEMIFGGEPERDLEERFDDEKVIDSPEIENYFITKPDISQEQVLIKSRKGKGLVIHGPPGTGKSQVITNIISDNLFRNKKILLVCEKRAALDVVKNRLASKGLSKHCLLVHDSQNDRNKTFHQMASVLNEYELNGSNLSSNPKELNKKKMLEKAATFDLELKNLKEVIELIHNNREFGVSLYSLYRLSKKDPKIILKIKDSSFKKINFNQLKESSEKISSLADRYYTYENSKFPLYSRQRFGIDFDELKFKEEIIQAIKVFESFEKIFYTKEFKEDLSQINFKKKITLEEICKIKNEINALKKFEQKKVSRIFNSNWWNLKSKYSNLRELNKIDEVYERWKLLDNSIGELKKTFTYIQKVFNKDFENKIQEKILKFDKNSVDFKEIKKFFSELDELITFDSKFEGLNEIETEIAKSCSELIKLDKKEDSKNVWKEVIENSFYLHWINEIESKEPLIRNFSNQTYEEIKNKLKILIDDKIDIIPKVIHESFLNKYNSLKWENYDYDGRRKNYNNLKKLIHELDKKRKRLTFRELFNLFYKEGLLDLFPCWMCSPETVSSIFPLKKGLFDIVIFDEASQTRLEKAIPSINRGKKLIIAGDSKQLPPSRFFMSTQEEEEDEESEDYDEKQLLENESLLERAKTVLPGKRLIYHYRSNHEELINFSNYAFYDKSLRVIPKNKIQKDSAIEFNNVKGTWDSGVNIKEAKEVVKKIKEILKEKGNQTLGVITFNIKQKDLIEELLDEEASKDPIFATLLDKERERYNQDEYIGLFVKNIENVQGDERDIIIFSVSYGYDKLNKFRYHFGPLNGPYGSNRLNVAISRAKEKILVFNSFYPKDLKYAGSFEGPKLLREYLSYCKSFSEKDFVGANEKLESLNETKSEIESQEFETYDSDFEGEVRDALVKLGYKVKTQVGCKGYKLDLAVVHPKQKEKFIVGIECDGAKYHSLKSAKERDLYRQGVLEETGWKILRVWSRDWWKNEEVETKRLDREIRKLI